VNFEVCNIIPTLTLYVDKMATLSKNRHPKSQKK